MYVVGMCAALCQSRDPEQTSANLLCPPPPLLNKYTSQSGPVLLPRSAVKAFTAPDALDFVCYANSLRLGQ